MKTFCNESFHIYLNVLFKIIDIKRFNFFRNIFCNELLFSFFNLFIQAEAATLNKPSSE